MPYSPKRFAAIMKNIKEQGWQYYVSSSGDVKTRWAGRWVNWDDLILLDKRATA